MLRYLSIAVVILAPRTTRAAAAGGMQLTILQHKRYSRTHYELAWMGGRPRRSEAGRIRQARNGRYTGEK